MDGCPVQAPKLISAKSTVVRCACCGAWAYRYPTFMGDDDYFECEKCAGCTSVQMSEGRPYGKKSKEWEWIERMFNELFTDISPYERDTVVTEPPLESLDWEAVEAWYRSKNIYRVFIGIEVTEVIAEE